MRVRPTTQKPTRSAEEPSPDERRETPGAKPSRQARSRPRAPAWREPAPGIPRALGSRPRTPRHHPRPRERAPPARGCGCRILQRLAAADGHFSAAPPSPGLRSTDTCLRRAGLPDSTDVMGRDSAGVERGSSTERSHRGPGSEALPSGPARRGTPPEDPRPPHRPRPGGWPRRYGTARHSRAGLPDPHLRRQPRDRPRLSRR